jgi:hypothetical protein
LGKDDHEKLKRLALLFGTNIGAILRRAGELYCEKMDKEAIAKEREFFRLSRKR